MKQHHTYAHTGDRMDLVIKCSSCVSNLHDIKIMHRDIKLSNFLVNRKDFEYTVVISDFGLAVTLENNNSLRTSGRVGTTSYKAPELMSMPTGTTYGIEVDVYSFGVLTWELLSGQSRYGYLQKLMKDTDGHGQTLANWMQGNNGQ